MIIQIACGHRADNQGGGLRAFVRGIAYACPTCGKESYVTERDLRDVLQKWLRKILRRPDLGSIDHTPVMKPDPATCEHSWQYAYMFNGQGRQPNVASYHCTKCDAWDRREGVKMAQPAQGDMTFGRKSITVPGIQKKTDA